MKDKYDVIIIGSGLSGLSAAVNLTDAGKKVLVLEGRKILGGRTSSWIDKGLSIESGLHRFLGFYEHLPELLTHIGINLDEMLVWEDEIEIKLPFNEPSATFGLAPLFKPMSTIKNAIGNNEFISLTEKIALAKFFSAGFIDFKKDPATLDKDTVASYAKKKDISPKIIQRVLLPLTEGLFFLTPDKYSAYNFFALFAPYITKLQKTRVGAFRGGMTEVMIDPVAKYISENKGEIISDKQVTHLIVDDSLCRGVMVDKHTIHASAVIIATSLASAQKLLQTIPHAAKHFPSFLSVPSMPSVTYQIDLNEPSMDIDRTTFSPGTIFSSYAEQSRTTFSDRKGRISIILAKPQKYLNMHAKDILPIILKDAKKLGINVSKKNIRDYRKVMWSEDFFTYERATYQFRPKQKTAISSLFLAGDYTEQQYLSTMEGSVVSGKLAAEAILQS